MRFRDCLERFLLGLLISSTGSAFELGPNWNCTCGNGCNSYKWVWIGNDRSWKRSDWCAFSALLLFSCTPARKMSPAQFSSFSSKWYRYCGNGRPICTKFLQFQMELSRGSTALISLKRSKLTMEVANGHPWTCFAMTCRVVALQKTQDYNSSFSLRRVLEGRLV